MADVRYTTAKALLDAVVAHYATAGVALPARQYVSPGPPFIDCAQATVHVVREFTHSGDVVDAQRPEAQASHPGHAMRGLEVAVTVVRPIPQPDDRGRPPKPAALDASAQEILGDAGLVDAAIRAYGRQVGCSSLAVVRWVALKAEGEFSGGQTIALISLV